MSKANSILSTDAESPKQKMPIKNVPIAPIPVHIMYAVLMGIVRWARYKNMPLRAMLSAPSPIKVQNLSAWRSASLNPNGHPTSKSAAMKR